MSEEEQLMAQIKSLASELEQSGEERVRLPSRLEDGTHILWYRERNRPSFAACLLFPLIMFCFLQRQPAEKTQPGET